MREISTSDAVNVILHNSLTYDSDLSLISKIDDNETKILIDDMRNVSDDSTTTERGDTLEKLVNYLLDKSNLFQRIQPDVRYNFCQVDHTAVFKPEIWSLFFGENKNLRNESWSFIAESKRYGRTLGVQYVLKFECVKRIRKIKFGAYFTIKGITGQDYEDSKAVIKRLYDIDDQFSIVFKEEDWNKIYENPKCFGNLFRYKIQEFFDSEII